MAPMHLFLLLEIYCSPSKASCPHLTHFLTKQVRVKPIEELQSWGLIEVDPSVVPPELNYEPHGFVVTEKGRAYVKAMENLPMPVQRWAVEFEEREESSLFDRVFGRGFRF